MHKNDLERQLTVFLLENFRIFLVDLLNFSFWSEIDIDDTGVPHPDRYRVTLHGVGYTGYWSMVAAINRGTHALA
jgi:hypothetical protein